MHTDTSRDHTTRVKKTSLASTMPLIGSRGRPRHNFNSNEIPVRNLFSQDGQAKIKKLRQYFTFKDGNRLKTSRD